MTTRRNVILLLTGLVSLGAIVACGLGSAPPGAPPPAAEEPTLVESALPAPTTIQLTPTALLSATAAGEPIPVESALPAPTTIQLSPTALPSATAASSLPEPGNGGFQPAITENRRLTLEFPPVMRMGDSTRIRLQLEVDDLGNITPTAVIEGNLVTGEVIQIPNLFDTHNVIAEARLDLAGILVQPSQVISEPLSPGKAVTFYWSVRPEKPGNYQGSAWLHLRFLPKTGGAESRIPIAVQFIDIQVNSFLGLISGSAARGFGAVGSVIGTVLGFPFMDDLLKWIWGKRKTKS